MVVAAAAKHDKQVRQRGQRMWREAGSPKGGVDDYIELARELQAFRDHPEAGVVADTPRTLRSGSGLISAAGVHAGAPTCAPRSASGPCRSARTRSAGTTTGRR